MSDVRIRPRQELDLAGSVEVLAAVYKRDGYPTTWPADPAAWLTPRNMAQGWVAVRDDETIVGHIVIRTSGDPPGVTALIGRLFVAPQARGRGLGATLLDQAKQWAHARGFSLMLEVTVDERAHAIALYERTGWRRVQTVTAPWTGPDGAVVTMHRYVLQAPP